MLFSQNRNLYKLRPTNKIWNDQQPDNRVFHSQALRVYFSAVSSPFHLLWQTSIMAASASTATSCYLRVVPEFMLSWMRQTGIQIFFIQGYIHCVKFDVPTVGEVLVTAKCCWSTEKCASPHHIVVNIDVRLMWCSWWWYLYDLALYWTIDVSSWVSSSSWLSMW